MFQLQFQFLPLYDSEPQTFSLHLQIPYAKASLDLTSFYLGITHTGCLRFWTRSCLKVEIKGLFPANMTHSGTSNWLADILGFIFCYLHSMKHETFAANL